MGQNLDALFHDEGHSDLDFVDFPRLLDPFFPLPGTADDITLLIMSNNHLAVEVNTILCLSLIHI